MPNEKPNKFSDAELERLRFPTGRFQWIEQLDTSQRNAYIQRLEDFPAQLQQAVVNYTPKDFLSTYRPGGWAAAQVIHHLADSHMHSFLRFKQTLSEDTPTITPYDEALWSSFVDGAAPQVDASLSILKGVHHRWTLLLKSLKVSDFTKKYYHPQNKLHFSLDQALALYAWHGQHHLAHIQNCKKVV